VMAPGERAAVHGRCQRLLRDAGLHRAGDGAAHGRYGRASGPQPSTAIVSAPSTCSCSSTVRSDRRSST
jgi:hypothetical protein